MHLIQLNFSLDARTMYVDLWSIYRAAQTIAKIFRTFHAKCKNVVFKRIMDF